MDILSRFEPLSVVDAFERSVKNAAHLKAQHSAHVAVGRVLARRIDELEPEGFIDERGKLDNVSVPTFLKALDALGLSVPVEKPVSRSRPVGVKQMDELAAMRKRVAGQ